jgi:hypothetical protein
MFLFQGTGNDPFTIFVFGAYERFGHTFVLSLRHSLSVMSVTFLLQTGAMAVLYAAGLACYRLEPSVSRYGWISRTSLYVIFALLSIGLIKMILPGGKMLIINNYTSVPLILVAGALISAWLLRGGSKEYILSIILFTFSLLFLTRVLLRANVIFYGNYLLVPSLACISVFYINILPKGLDSFFGGRGGAKTYYCLACAVYLVMTALPFFQYNLRVYSSKIVMTVTERGTLRTANYRPNVVFWQMVDFIKNNTPADGRLVVIPEGNGINYFSGRPSPIKYEQFIPNVLRSIGEARMVKELNDAAIDYIVLTQRYTPEYGYPCFGVDYGKAVMSWINDNYEVVKVIGDKPYAGKGGYGMAIYRKKWNCPLTMETKANCGETASD